MHITKTVNYCRAEKVCRGRRVQGKHNNWKSNFDVDQRMWAEKESFIIYKYSGQFGGWTDRQGIRKQKVEMMTSYTHIYNYTSVQKVYNLIGFRYFLPIGF